MHIKQIIIQGFKSYKDQTVIEPFSAGHNVIVGRNGSGKSNFFAAIRFVLGDAYTQLSKEERAALLHEGSGSAVMSAYVEIIFDNTDDRFRTGRPELILRRSIGVKKDEYSIDRKSSTKTEVMNLLESAGFSRANPYYIVPQGRVTALTAMKDAERLDVLKSVAGTQVYETRRAESLRIMEDTDNKRAKIDDLLEYIHERLAQLEEEKEELRKYQEKDRESRSLHYHILSLGQQHYQEKLDDLDAKRNDGVDETDDNRQLWSQLEQEIEDLEDQIDVMSREIEVRKADRQQLDLERKENVRAKAKIEVEFKALTEGQSAAQQARQRHAQDLARIQREIQERETELSKLNPQFDQSQGKEDEILSRLQDARDVIKRLRGKQGRLEHFKSKKDRDDALRNAVTDIKQKSAAREAYGKQRRAEIAESKKEIGKLEGEISSLESQLNNRGDSGESMKGEIETAQEQSNKLSDSRLELWRTQTKLNQEVTHADNKLRSAGDNLQRLTNRSTWQAIKTIRRVKERGNIPGLHGTLGELLQVNEKYRTAAEVAAGDSLFHYLVDNDQTADEVVKILNKEKGGRITLVPLSKIRPRPINFQQTGDAMPLMSKVRYDPQFEKAFQQVFGKTIVCENLTVGSQYARSHGVTAITTDGNRAGKKGDLVGGWHDPKASKLDAIHKEALCRTEYEKLREQRDEVERSLERLEQEITRAKGEVQRAEQKSRQQDYGFTKAYDDLNRKREELQGKKDQLERLERAKKTVEEDERRLAEERQGFEAEMASQFTKALTRDEEQQLEVMTQTERDLGPQLADLSRRRAELESRKNAIDEELRLNLRPTLSHLNAQAFEHGGTGNTAAGNQLTSKQKELQRADVVLKGVRAKLHDADEAIESANAGLGGLNDQKGNMQKQLDELSRRIERHQTDVEKNMRQRSQYQEKLEKTNQEIRELGVLPEEAFEKYKNWNEKKAMDRLVKVREALKKFTGVNKKAFEQYNNFTKQRETLEKRRQELDQSRESIEGLIEHLDQKKDEAIERTFKQVSKEFANVFEMLVPAGKGRLLIQRRPDLQKGQRLDDEDSEDERRRQNSVENYIGVGISVSFNSKHDEQQRIQQLSGGQKSKSSIKTCSIRDHSSDCPSRSVRSCPYLRDPAMRSRTILPLRRDRRQPRCSVPNRRRRDDQASCRGSGPGARIGQRDGRRPVHLHDFPPGNGARGRQVLRRHVHKQDVEHRRRGPRGGVRIRRGRDIGEIGVLA